ncbi:hypothetical protein C5N14_22760 [Micromonospora sp. MW-13]|uniref:hypothetical protein n=1 Tax=Micromonospora sp. MW-13 TaxID=2094022 RepID=UPI000E440EA6|nr:hypothetical protein [Micromonospora sp. MW-13]RGC66583.1 hypothetical protein C5N14_22760 [Micromonospora sp. MW-13]
MTIARDGLASLHRRMAVLRADGTEIGLGDVFATSTDVEPLRTATVTGTGAVERELSLPYRGRRLRGDDLRRRLDAWVTAGVVEPSCADAVRAVMANPDWLDLRDQRIVVLGAGAEMGPLPSVLRWGGDVVAVDLPRPEIWRRLLHTTRRSGGRLHLPVPAGTGTDDGALAARAGADLLHHLPQVADWLLGVDGRLVLGNYVYADGATNVRVATAVDALTVRLQDRRDDVALAFLATPTDVFAVPGDAVQHAERGYAARGIVRRSLRVASGGRLLHRQRDDVAGEVAAILGHVGELVVEREGRSALRVAGYWPGSFASPVSLRRPRRPARSTGPWPPLRSPTDPPARAVLCTCRRDSADAGRKARKARRPVRAADVPRHSWSPPPPPASDRPQNP